jgi:Ulp1 family protease
MDPANDDCKVVDVTLPGGFGYYLYGSNFKCLRPSTWLNSETIDAYLSMAKGDVQFTEYLRGINNWSQNEVLICDSTVMRKIVPRNSDQDGDLTAQHKSSLDFTLKWARRQAKDMCVQTILALKLWILPYNLGNVHWVLVAVDIDAKRVTLYESYSQGDHAAALAKVVDVLKLQARRDKLSESPWEVEVIHTGHQDGDATECGVFMVAHAMYIIQGKARSITSQCTLHNIRLFRKRIAADILQGYITFPK